nr:PREDICTED: mitogen-activated protein kinase-binding protein 1 [Latimeria chalumnae]|eukprot:XP_014351589.1 PREDICTED: mitogen-activated protein kinase-binding protein 1 [Latimeria chalumnae]
MSGEGSTIKSRIRNLLRSPSIKLRRGKAATREDLGNKVTLEKVLGITVSGGRGLACDPKTGLIAYPGGCCVVLWNPRGHKKKNPVSSSQKTITALAFSPDGKYLVTGESGHMPAVRVWDVAERSQVAELQEHKYGVACVAFSPNAKYIVSVGYQHDMIVNVWAWKKNIVVAANKVSSKVTAVSFSESSTYFVTAGNRHVKFWYLGDTKTSKVNATVPLLGRSGLLGDLRNNFFSDVACGRGKKADSTFCITSSGLLCEFSEKRLLDKWVELRNVDSFTTTLANCISVNEDFIFCGCADGTVRIFNPFNLHFISTMPKPHYLGMDIAAVTEPNLLFASKVDAKYPDTIAVTFDPANRWLSCVYSDHSLYVWDVKDSKKIGKVYSALYHASCVWSIEVYPEVKDCNRVCLPPGSFITCSSDNTVRLWNTDGCNIHGTVLHRNIISSDLMKIVYMDNNTQTLLDLEYSSPGSVEKTDTQAADTKTGIRTLCVSPDGQHLASGDRTGTLRVHELRFLGEILRVEAHDSEILCLEYSQPETGLNLLASASRDRLIHVLDAGNDYSLQQTLDEHSSSITAVKFAANDGKVRLISCGADKSVYFRTGEKSPEGIQFTRTHHIVRKTTLYDMDVDSTRKYAAVGCQDRSIRIFNISNGKQKKLYKGSQGEDGTLIKVQTDPSGLYIATSCSDKNLSVFNFYSGECVATMFGHSEIVTGMKFSNDCKHLISVSGDSCIFIWRLSSEMTINMRQRLAEMKQKGKQTEKSPPRKPSSLIRRETYNIPSPAAAMSSDSEKEADEDGNEEEESPSEISFRVPSHLDSASEGGGDSAHHAEVEYSRKVPTWDVKKVDEVSSVKGSDTALNAKPRQRGRWSHRLSSIELTVKSMLDLRQLETFTRSRSASGDSLSQSSVFGDAGEPEEPDRSSLQTLVEDSYSSYKESKPRSRPQNIRLPPRQDGGFPRQVETPQKEERVIYLQPADYNRSHMESEYEVKLLQPGKVGKGYRGNSCPDKHSPDSACSVDYSSSRLSSPEHRNEDLPGRTQQGCEPLSMSSRFLARSQSPVVRSESPSPTKIVLEQKVSLDPQRTFQSKPTSEQLAQNQNGNRPANAPPGAETDKTPTPSRLTYAQRKRNPTLESRHISTGDGKVCAGGAMRKSLSVHDLAHDERMAVTLGAPKTRLQMLTVAEKEQRANPRRTLPSTPLRPDQPSSPVAKEGLQTKAMKQRSYMNPTTSSMAKVSRSVSMGENLNFSDSSEHSSTSEERRALESSRRSSIVPSLEDEKSKQPNKDNVLGKPVIQHPSNTSLPNPLSAKPGASSKPHLTLEIPKHLPDRPSLVSFSPTAKPKTHFEVGAPRSPIGVAKRKPSFPDGRPCQGDKVSTPIQEKMLLLQPQGSMPSQQDETKLSLQHKAAAERKHSMTSIDSGGFREESPTGGCQLEDLPLPGASGPLMHRSSSDVSLKSSGAQGLPSLLFIPLSCSFILQRVAFPSHFFTSSFWPVSSSVFCSLCSSIHRHLIGPAVGVEDCKAVAAELQDSLQKALDLYKAVTSAGAASLENTQIAGILTESFSHIRKELDTLDCSKMAERTPQQQEVDLSPSPLRSDMLVSGSELQLRDSRTLELLEQYSELLLQAVERKMNRKL